MCFQLIQTVVILYLHQALKPKENFRFQIFSVSILNTDFVFAGFDFNIGFLSILTGIRNRF